MKRLKLDLLARRIVEQAMVVTSSIALSIEAFNLDVSQKTPRPYQPGAQHRSAPCARMRRPPAACPCVEGTTQAACPCAYIWTRVSAPISARRPCSGPSGHGQYSFLLLPQYPVHVLFVVLSVAGPLQVNELAQSLAPDPRTLASTERQACAFCSRLDRSRVLG